MKALKLFTLFLLIAITARAQTITILQPNGGETLIPGRTHRITWNAEGTSNNYNSTNNGSIC